MWKVVAFVAEASTHVDYIKTSKEFIPENLSICVIYKEGISILNLHLVLIWILVLNVIIKYYNLLDNLSHLDVLLLTIIYCCLEYNKFTRDEIYYSLNDHGGIKDNLLL